MHGSTEGEKARMIGPNCKSLVLLFAFALPLSHRSMNSHEKSLVGIIELALLGLNFGC
jgi:hypothetical protein